ncbi:major facilitator superfamily permease [Staphylococcus gallinarum]|uniref:Major facilitator superfamily permease n=1 Tax=Staphylococcus gallinarum TaxID=1293 RepID=A0A380FLP9_STAGA|nr:major facilitator superfamily permease [Staphylococcus gallinarum]
MQLKHQLDKQYYLILTDRLTTTQAVSYHSFIINICRSIGPAIAGFVVATYNSEISFALQALCYFISLLLCLPLSFNTHKIDKVDTEVSFKYVVDYFKENNVGARIFITSLFNYGNRLFIYDTITSVNR